MTRFFSFTCFTAFFSAHRTAVGFVVGVAGRPAATGARFHKTRRIWSRWPISILCALRGASRLLLNREKDQLMSLRWQFSAYPAGTFAGIFGATRPDAIAAFPEVIAWAGTDGGADIDIPTTQQLARHVLSKGLDYQACSKEQSKNLDDLVSLALSPE